MNIAACMALAAAFNANPHSLTVGQPDTLRLCVVEQMDAIVNDQRDRREIRAFERLHGVEE